VAIERLSDMALVFFAFSPDALYDVALRTLEWGNHPH
jgi:hypothetical protein